MATLTQRLIEQAIAETQRVITITRCDGSTYQGTSSYATATEGRFQVYVIPVERRASSRRPHVRVTYYLDNKRVKREVFEAAVAAAQDTPADHERFAALLKQWLDRDCDGGDNFELQRTLLEMCERFGWEVPAEVK
jgi:hypothetical protein